MKIKTQFLAAALLAITIVCAHAASSPPVGQPAPDFIATDVDGQQVTLSQFKGKTVVLEWTNKDCPFVHKHYDSGAMQALQKAATAQGVVWLTIVSSAPGKEGYVTDAEAKKSMADWHGMPSDEILDPTGAIGHLYGARATPNMFVIDPTGTLVYEGAIDDKPTADKADIPAAHNYVKAALEAVANHQSVTDPVTQPYGCAVKY
jgi:peroxiredoxin